MNSLPLFQRSPRTFPSVPTDEVEIQSPSPIPTRPTSSLVSVLLPSLGMIIGVVLSVMLALFASNTGGYSLLGLVITIPMTIGSAAASIYSYKNERKKYRQSVEDRERLYRAHLVDRRKTLEDLATQQRRASLEIHPDYTTCLAIARRQHPEDARHLWERSSGLERPRDPDFLYLRLGTGRLPATFKVKPPASRSQVGEADELYDQAIRLAQEFQNVDGVAVSLPLAQIGSAGLAGPRSSLLESARALLIHFATLHAPNEVKIVALLPAHELAEWDWLRWLPHVWDDERKHRFIASTPDEIRALLATLFPFLQRRALGRAPDDAKTLHHPAYVFLFADPALYTAASDTSVIGPLMHLLVTQGANIGAYSMFLNERPDALPSACGAVVDLSGGNNRLRLVGPPTQEFPFSPDRVGAARVDAFARALAPVRVKPLATQSDIPSNIPLTALLKTTRLDDYPVLQHWQQRDSHQTLEAPLGIEAGGGTILLNFQDAARHGDGSHAMVGGTTGTGKTRFLQTMIVLLAAHHHPHDVNFILIDYKGGDLLQGLENLPHVVGTLANLEKQDAQAVLIERLFVCLDAELRRRRNLIGGLNINEYQRDVLQGKFTEPLSHLFVVIDEFAEMIRNSPDKAATTKRLLSIGATGRSLGVHLVLATQDPSGVVTDELRNNINIRLCLRMGSRQASTDILRLPDAYEKITSAQVGRAYLQTGNNDRFVAFQVAWGGDAYIPGQTSAMSGEIREVGLNGLRTSLRRFHSLVSGGGDTQIATLARHIQKTADDQGLTRLKSPLSPPLQSLIFLDDLRRGKPGWNGHGWETPANAPWLAPIVGQSDDPANQAQESLRLPLGTEGHFALYGEPGSGKTTFIQTLVTSLALSYSPEEIHLYLIDFSGQRLLTLKSFPQVGDVFLGDEVERLKRFFRYLTGELKARKGQFARAGGAANLRDYCAMTHTSLPAMVIILEDYATFFKVCQNRNLDLDDTLANLIRDGSSYGLHFVLTMTSPSELKSRLANSISLSATYHLATPDYGMAVGPTGGLVPAPYPGRGLYKGAPMLEFQTALPVRGNTDPERTLALKVLMDQMGQAGPRPRAFLPIPAVVGLSQIVFLSDRWLEPSPAGLTASFAIDLEDPDQPFDVDLRSGPYFLVAGTPQCGKTTLLQSWILSLAERYSPSRLLLYLVDFRRSGMLGLSDLPHVTAPVVSPKGRKMQKRDTGYITDEDRFGLALAEIGEIMQERQSMLDEARKKARGAFNLRVWLDAQSALLMVIDDFDVFESEVQSGVNDLLNANLKKWRDLGFTLIVSGPITKMENAYGWITQLSDAPVGFQLGTAAYNQVFKVNSLPVDNLSKHLMPGEAFYIRRGQPRQVKIADPQVGPVPLAEWVERIGKR